MGHERPGRAGSGSGHVRFAPKATVGHENAIRRLDEHPEKMRQRRETVDRVIRRSLPVVQVGLIAQLWQTLVQ